ncbi:hypothetical protein NUH30_17665 [Leptospira sp. 85282-16]|uniref:Lipoprotein n=1 Tax=Leptospira montravelensis TaxID=2484961 RepID=A0ABY2LRQ4_9LEPT|nr:MULTISPECIES: hypothetical protein [Leptospira]MCT8335515.1 hypothetical protein [Leptospira sp. 85282-16]TGK86523.1 hypothetical protein EHQ19_01015 [Leptospira montravelensis]TGL02779.1 hypothetical protein EHQ31_08860 [Leptospira montravelensis]
MAVVFLRFSLLFLLFFIFNQCTKTNPSYEACERADLDYLACSLVVYQSYTYCGERSSAVTGSAETKADAKFQCDAERLIGSYLCEDIKKKTCGTK